MPVHKDESVQKKEAWYYAFEVKDPSTGKRKTIKQRGFRSRREAELEEVDARNSWNKGIYISPDNTLLGDYLKHWIKHKQNISDQTRYVNEGHINNHIIPLIGHWSISKIRADVIEEFTANLQKRNLADSTIRKIFNIVNTALNAAVRREMILKNPVTMLESKPRVRKSKIDPWSVEEIKKFLSSFDNRYKIVYKLAIYTGMRQGEIMGLGLSDVDLANRKINIRQTLDFNGLPKAGAKTLSGNRSIDIPDDLYDDIKAQYDLMMSEIVANGEDYNKHRLFICTTKGHPCRKQQLVKSWHIFLEKSGVRKVRFHDLRHTCASLLLSIGTHPKVVQELLGHSSIKITMDLYSHLMPSMKSDALNDLGKLLSD